MITCNVIIPQFFWFKRCGATSGPCMFVISIFVNIGMWFERFVIIVTSLHRDFLPELGLFFPTWVDILTFDRQLRPVLHAVPAVLPGFLPMRSIIRST
jgi:hypothetical protein